VVSIEASRLARNGQDWHTLLKFCGLVGTLIPMDATDRIVATPRMPAVCQLRKCRRVEAQ
jgi:hypothetical protein